MPIHPIEMAINGRMKHMAGHPSGNPELIRQHKEKQREGDEELTGKEPANSNDNAKDRRESPIGRKTRNGESGISDT